MDLDRSGFLVLTERIQRNLKSHFSPFWAIWADPGERINNKSHVNSLFFHFELFSTQFNEPPSWPPLQELFLRPFSSIFRFYTQKRANRALLLLMNHAALIADVNHQDKRIPGNVVANGQTAQYHGKGESEISRWSIRNRSYFCLKRNIDVRLSRMITICQSVWDLLYIGTCISNFIFIQKGGKNILILLE